MTHRSQLDQGLISILIHPSCKATHEASCLLLRKSVPLDVVWITVT